MHVAKIRRSLSKAREGTDDTRTAIRWYYVRFPPWVLERAALVAEDTVIVTVFTPDGGRPPVINIRKADAIAE